MNDSNFCYESKTGPTKSQIKWDWLSTKPDKDTLPDTPLEKKPFHIIHYIGYMTFLLTLYWVHFGSHKNSSFISEVIFINIR